MSNLSYTLVSNADADQSNITVFIPGERSPLVAQSDHPNFKSIVAQVIADEPEGLADLFDTAKAAARRFERLGERVTVTGGTIYLDGDPIDNALTQQVVAFLDEDVDDWEPLVKFFEKVQSNPNEHSREQLYTWLSARQFAIADNGDIVGYRGVTPDENGVLCSAHSGTAIVDGETITGRIPNPVGSIIEMPRSAVTFDPGTSCSNGLHVADFDYASSWGRGGAVLRVLVNPRDVVSVPTEGGSFPKMRVCRFLVDAVVEGKASGSVVQPDRNWDEDDYEEDETTEESYCEECGDYSDGDALCEECEEDLA